MLFDVEYTQTLSIRDSRDFRTAQMQKGAGMSDNDLADVMTCLWGS